MLENENERRQRKPVDTSEDEGEERKLGKRKDIFEKRGRTTTGIQEELKQKGTIWWEVEERSREIETQTWYSKIEASRYAEEAEELLKEDGERTRYIKEKGGTNEAKGSLETTARFSPGNKVRKINIGRKRNMKGTDYVEKKTKPRSTY